MNTVTKWGILTTQPWVLIGLLLVTGGLLLTACGNNAEAIVRKTVEDTTKAVKYTGQGQA